MNEDLSTNMIPIKDGENLSLRENNIAIAHRFISFVV